jgi:hypothetical protein
MPRTTSSPPDPATDPAHSPLSRRFRLGWLVEAVVLVVLLLLHDMLRNAVMGSAFTALDNAKTLTSIERTLGIYHELGFQRFFIDAGRPIIGLCNLWFETMHFIVPLVVAVYLYLRFPGRYTRMRNAFLIMLFLTAPLVWGVFPVTPPKYMPDRYGFVETQVKYWNIFPQKPIKYGPDGEPTAASVALEGNLYGGIPSHHLSWALWCALALWPVIRRRWLRNLLLLYPLTTLTAVIATGNHRFIDLAGSLAEVAIAYGLANLIERALDQGRARGHLGESATETALVADPEPVA